MPVIVTPPASITVRVGSATQPHIQTTSTFSGSSASQAEIDAAFAAANTALTQSTAASTEANTAFSLANTALQTSGGEITGNLIIDGTFKANIDGGLF